MDAHISDRIADMLTIAADIPQLAVPALAALVRTGKVGTGKLQMIC